MQKDEKKTVCQSILSLPQEIQCFMGSEHIMKSEQPPVAESISVTDIAPVTLLLNDNCALRHMKPPTHIEATRAHLAQYSAQPISVVHEIVHPFAIESNVSGISQVEPHLKHPRRLRLNHEKEDIGRRFQICYGRTCCAGG